MEPTDVAAGQPIPEELDNATETPSVDAKTKKRWAELRQQIEITKTYRKQLVRNWSTNIDYRRGKLFSSQSDDDTIAVNMDWSLTKTKHASLFSQVPKIRINHVPESVQNPWAIAFERRLNDLMRTGGIESAMDEVMPDCINAAGIGIALVSYEAITEDRDVPAIDLTIFPPEVQQEIVTRGTLFGEEIPMTTVPFPIDTRYIIRRISPADLLWPVDFTGSDFDNAPWIGHTGRIPWAEAVIRFKLKEEDKEHLLSDETTIEDRLSHDYDRERAAYENKLGYDELFYYEHQFDTEAKSFGAIHHVVFLHGRTDPVIDEPWSGQRIDADKDGKPKIIGSQKRPIRVLTLTYVSDESIPPSDSAIGRSQVNEINKGRTQASRQRDRAIAQNWFDVNRLDPAIQQALMRGTWQHAIPVQGEGSKIVGQIQQAKFSPETFQFDNIAKSDLNEQWTIGPNQIGSGAGVETKGEAGFIQTNFTTKIARERAKVGSFVIGIAQVLGGLMCLYEDPAVFGEGFTPEFAEALDYSILVDSTVLLDSQQRLQNLDTFINKYGKSGWVDLEPVFKEIAALVGLDASVIRPPNPQPPEQPNISLRLTGSQDMMNPLMLAFLLKSGQAPDPELIEKAKTLIQMSVVEQQPVVPNGPQVPEPPPIPTGEANPQMTAMPSVVKRSDDPSLGAGGRGGNLQ